MANRSSKSAEGLDGVEGGAASIGLPQTAGKRARCHPEKQTKDDANILDRKGTGLIPS